MPIAQLASPGFRSASEPPEARGVARDRVRLLIAGPHDIRHSRFCKIGDYLTANDLLVVNTSATLPAAVDVVRGSGTAALHFSTALPDGTWAIEFRPGHRATGPARDVRAGEVVELPGCAMLRVVGSYAVGDGKPPRLWRCAVSVDGTVAEYLRRYGRPIAYDYVPSDWPLESYQTVFGREQGSAEMPSAGRPFSHEVVTDLVTRGIQLAPILLHTGVSSLEQGEPPLPERFSVPASTARLVNATHRSGGRVIAVGTTVTRALETVAKRDGTVRGGHGWTTLVLGPARSARVVDGIITGWHEPGASHLNLLEAVVGRDLVSRAYASARASGYRWHEFGDSALLLSR